jgi:hypothetical protein
MMNWKETTEERYWEMLEILPPATMTGLGFLVGEPMDHRACPVTGNFGARFEAYAKDGEKYFVASEPMTVAGFKTVTARDLYPRANS